MVSLAVAIGGCNPNGIWNPHPIKERTHHEENVMTPTLFRVILPVCDVERAAKFYGAVLGLPGKRISPGRHYFRCGETILACFDAKADGDAIDTKPNPDHIYFAVDDLESTYTAIQKAGGTLSDADDRGPMGQMGEIAMRPWGERSFYAIDPFGNKICFVDRSTMFTGE